MTKPNHRQRKKTKDKNKSPCSCFPTHVSTPSYFAASRAYFDGFSEFAAFVGQDLEFDGDFFAGAEHASCRRDAKRGARRKRRTKDLEMTLATPHVGEGDFTVK